MPKISALVQRTWRASSTAYKARILIANIKRAVFTGPKPLRVLLASDGEIYTSEQQFRPLLKHEKALSEHLGIVIQKCLLSDVLTKDPEWLARFDLIGVKLSFRTNSSTAPNTIRKLKKNLANAQTRLVYFDGDDDLNVQWPTILKHVDLYVKKHVFADKQDYQKQYIGKSNLTDLVARENGTSFADDIIPSSGGANPADTHKIHLGWNIALDDKLEELRTYLTTVPEVTRDFDVTCRAHVSPDAWIHPLRATAAERIEQMSPRFRVNSPRDRVSQTEYYNEMLRSRICVSPFGFGEICWRDFEAILCGCLLVKPDMGHLRTAPNLFKPGLTYVPVKWDFSNLEDVCADYLENEEERNAIAQRARAELLEALEPEWMVQQFSVLLNNVGLPASNNQ